MFQVVEFRGSSSYNLKAGLLEDCWPDSVYPSYKLQNGFWSEPGVGNILKGQLRSSAVNPFSPSQLERFFGLKLNIEPPWHLPHHSSVLLDLGSTTTPSSNGNIHLVQCGTVVSLAFEWTERLYLKRSNWAIQCKPSGSLSLVFFVFIQLFPSASGYSGEGAPHLSSFPLRVLFAEMPSLAIIDDGIWR